MEIFYVKNDFAHNEKVEKYNYDIIGRGVKDPEEADMIVCGGGDGTLLKTIKEFGHLNKPFWGFNAGTVGFLMNNGYPSDFIRNSDFKVKSFNMIDVTVNYRTSVRDMSSIFDKTINVSKTFEAFNDVCIGGDMNSWINFDVKEKDKFFGEFMGGGLIISTPQGSTGINKNNGGIILPLSSTLWSITGDKTNRDIEYVIKPRRTEIKVRSRTPVSVWVDGSNDIITNVESVIIRKGRKVNLAFGDYDSFQRKRRL